MREHKEDLTKIGLSAVLLAGLMILFHFVSVSWWVELLAYLVPYLIIGGEVLKEAGEGIIHGEIFGECFLMSIATIGALCIGEYPEAVFVMLFFAVGELFEHIASDKSRKSISGLMNVRPDSANVYKDGEIIAVSPEQVNLDDIIVIKPGERIPLDGVVIDGTSSLNTVDLTGESLPRDVTVGDTVLSGCVNINGLLRVRATSVYAESTAARILNLVESASDKKAKTEGFITRFSKVYTPVVVALAVLLAVIPSLIWGEWSIWISRALLFLVVSCPCALVVSVPLTYFSGMGGASKKGILIKGASALENVSKVGTVVMDKTGTLTKGNFLVTAVHPQKINKEELLEIAAVAESFSDHPISLSLKAAYTGEIDKKRVTDVSDLAGRGVSVKIDGRQIHVGNGKLMQDIGVSYRDCHHIGTAVHIAVDGEYAGHIIISDELKPDSVSAVASFKKAGIRTYMLTGDHTQVAEKIAAQTKVDGYSAGLLPADKVSEFEKILGNVKSGAKVAFVGDGINDAPVIACADVGIAMGGLGSDAAIEAADMVIMDDKLSKIPLAIALSKKTGRIVWQNIIISLTIKFGILALATVGLSNMWLASFADVGVLVIAVLNATRAMKIKE